MNPADGGFADTLRALMALPRYGTGDEIAAMVAYLAGPRRATSPARASRSTAASPRSSGRAHVQEPARVAHRCSTER